MDAVTPSTQLPRRKRVVPRRDSHGLHVVEGDGSDEGIYLDLRPEALDGRPEAEVPGPRFRTVAGWLEAPRDYPAVLGPAGDARSARGGRPASGAGRTARHEDADRAADHTGGRLVGHVVGHTVDLFVDDVEDPSQDPYAAPPPDDGAPGTPPTEEYTVRAEWLESTPERVQSARTPVWLPSMEYAAQAEFLDSMPDLPMSPWATPRPSAPTQEYLVRAEQLEWLPERVGLTPAAGCRSSRTRIRTRTRTTASARALTTASGETFGTAGFGAGDTAFWAAPVGGDDEPRNCPLAEPVAAARVHDARRPDRDGLAAADRADGRARDPGRIGSGRPRPEAPDPRAAHPGAALARTARPEPSGPRPCGPRPSGPGPGARRTDPGAAVAASRHHVEGETPEHSSHFPASGLRGPLPADPPVAPRMVRGPLGEELNIFASLPDDDL